MSTLAEYVEMFPSGSEIATLFQYTNHVRRIAPIGQDPTWYDRDQSFS
jgi:hypothetical protein